jgi:Flp pilus assembly protein TadG
MTGHTPRNRFRGVAAVEFALILPVFSAMVFGLIEVGQLMELDQAVTAAARAGAREAALSGSTEASTIAQALVPLTLVGVSTTGINPVLTPSDPATAAADSSVSVQVTVPLSSFSAIGLFFESLNVSAKCTLQKED